MQVGVPGGKRRYCQQCSIFHTVAEFDDEKRCGVSEHIPSAGTGASTLTA
jgi:SBP domain